MLGSKSSPGDVIESPEQASSVAIEDPQADVGCVVQAEANEGSSMGHPLRDSKLSPEEAGERPDQACSTVIEPARADAGCSEQVEAGDGAEGLAQQNEVHVNMARDADESTGGSGSESSHNTPKPATRHFDFDELPLEMPDPVRRPKRAERKEAPLGGSARDIRAKPPETRAEPPRIHPPVQPYRAVPPVHAEKPSLNGQPSLTGQPSSEIEKSEAPASLGESLRSQVQQSRENLETALPKTFTKERDDLLRVEKRENDKLALPKAFRRERDDAFREKEREAAAKKPPAPGFVQAQRHDDPEAESSPEPPSLATLLRTQFDRLTSLELCLALELPASSIDTADGQDMLLAMVALGVKDLQGLRKEVNRKLLPKHKTREGGAKSGVRESPSTRRQTDAATPKLLLEMLPAGGSTFKLPSEEEALVALAERILELESFKEVLRTRLEASDYARAYEELLEQGVGSIAALAAIHTISTIRLQVSQALHEEAVRQVSENEEQQLARRCEILRCGQAPFIATAPHNIFLRRDGDKPHMREDFTGAIAQELARGVRGCALCWTKVVQWRTEFRYALTHRHKAQAAGDKKSVDMLDASNRDPNFLHVDELPKNPWFCRLEAWAADHRSADQCCQALHVDVHGCQDPPKNPSHVIIGLRAMSQHVESLKQGPEREQAQHRLDVFGQMLKHKVASNLAPAVAGIIALGDIVNVTGVGTSAGGNLYDDVLTGGYPKSTKRRTLSQQSVLHVGMSHSLQLEISMLFRKVLFAEPATTRELGRTIQECWMESLKSGNCKSNAKEKKEKSAQAPFPTAQKSTPALNPIASQCYSVAQFPDDFARRFRSPSAMQRQQGF